VGLKYKEEVEGKEKTFDYHFDYILSPMVRMSLTAIEAATREPLQTLIPNLVRNGYTFSGNGFVDDFPAGRPSVIEIMTCSTSSNNKKKRTTIPMAFEDAMLGRDHNAPGINYRQVWARMVSQLIVKTEVALNWGGPALWIVQDVLVDYICSSTALDIRKFLAERIGEVNMLSLSYGDRQNADRGVIELSVGALYAGPISSAPPENARPSFQDMLRAPLKPELWRLTRLLTGKQPVNRITLR